MRGARLAGRRLEARQQGAGVGEARVEIAPERGRRVEVAPDLAQRVDQPVELAGRGRERVGARRGREARGLPRRVVEVAPVGFAEPGRERLRLLERLCAAVTRGVSAPQASPKSGHDRLDLVERPGHAREQLLGGAADRDLRAAEEVALGQRDLRSGQLDRFPVEQGPELVRPPRTAQLLRALEQLLELALPPPQVGQRGARLRPAVGRSPGERAHVEQLAARVDLELDQVGGDAVARLLEVAQLMGGVVAAHVNRRTVRWEGTGSVRTGPGGATSRRAAATSRCARAGPEPR